MSTLYERVMLARTAGRVRRYHTFDLIKNENDAEHTFNVMNLLLLITGGRVSREALVAALKHDMGEYLTGDMPGNIKHDMPNPGWFAGMELKAMHDIHPDQDTLSLEEASLIKLCDVLDGLLKCMHEYSLGNKEIEKVGNVYVQYVQDVRASMGGGALLLEADNLIVKLINMWRQRNE